MMSARARRARAAKKSNGHGPYRVVGYVRVSTDEQADKGVSLDNQEERIRAHAFAKDWELTRIYRDEGWSGKDLRRPAASEMLEAARAKAFDAIIVYKVDRLTRRQKDLWQLLEDVLEPAGVGFVSVSEPFDTTTAIGKACLGMIAVFAQLERDTIAERTRDALAYKLANGERVGAPALSESVVDGELRPVAEELATVDRMAALWRSGRTYAEIVEAMNAEGRATKRGGRWHRSTVRYLLREVAPRLGIDVRRRRRRSRPTAKVTCPAASPATTASST